jgi:hypothetical protein
VLKKQTPDDCHLQESMNRTSLRQMKKRQHTFSILYSSDQKLILLGGNWRRAFLLADFLTQQRTEIQVHKMDDHDIHSNILGNINDKTRFLRQRFLTVKADFTAVVAIQSASARSCCSQVRPSLDNSPFLGYLLTANSRM